MPVLDWIGKAAVVGHDAQVPYRLLQDVPELTCGEAASGNLILEGDCWIRNVERKPSSFSLPTSTGRFYPDFHIRMQNGGLIAAAYKGAHLASGAGSAEKKRMGELWERRSAGRCAFAWVEKGGWAALDQAAARCAGRRTTIGA